MIIVDPEIEYRFWVPLFKKFIRLHLCQMSCRKLLHDFTFIICETSNELNKKRMMKRKTDGDLNRGRQDRYVKAQNFAYFASSLIFDWPCFFTIYEDYIEEERLNVKNIQDKIPAIINNWINRGIKRT